MPGTLQDWATFEKRHAADVDVFYSENFVYFSTIPEPPLAPHSSSVLVARTPERAADTTVEQ